MYRVKIFQNGSKKFLLGFVNLMFKWVSLIWKKSFTLIIWGSSVEFFGRIFNEEFTRFHSNLYGMDVIDYNITTENLSSAWK